MNHIEINKLIHNMSYEDYAKLPYLRQSQLKWLERSPAHYKASLNKQSVDSDALRFGRIIHTAILEPDRFEKHFVVEPVFEGFTKDGRLSNRSGAALQIKKEWYANIQPDQIVMTVDERNNLKGMIASLLAHPIARRSIEGSSKEAVLTWVQDEMHCMARFDYISKDGLAFDIKSTKNADPRFFYKEIYRMLYHFQAGHYCNGAHISEQLRADAFTFIGVEKEAPWGVCSVTIEKDALKRTRKKCSDLVRLFRDCTINNNWPCYPVESVSCQEPMWAYDNQFIQEEF